MPTSLTIPKNPVYPASMDWTFLRREGIRHIERLGSSIWTDYNLHDPGITILEVLCYAITDLGYRSNLEPKDLFASSSDKAFLTAQHILPNAPVTALDFRKLLIDIPGVKNAWVEQMDEPEMRFHLDNTNVEDLRGQLNYYLGLIGIKSSIGDIPSITEFIVDDLSGLSSCDEEIRTAAKEKLKIPVEGESLKRALIIYAAIHHYNEIRLQLNDQSENETINKTETQNRVCILFELATIADGVRQEDFMYDWSKQLTTSDSTLVDLIDNDSAITEVIYQNPFAHLLLGYSLGVEAVVEDDSYNLFIPQGVYQISLDIEDTAKTEMDDIKEEALAIMLQHRNLGEDVHPEVKVIEKKDIGIHLDLMIEPSRDELELMTEVYYAIYNYLIPDVHFYSLEQMLNKYALFRISSETLTALEDALLPTNVLNQLNSLLEEEYVGIAAFQTAIRMQLNAEEWGEYGDTIFVKSEKQYDANKVYQGPLLRHGFIDEQELLSAQPRQTVFRSDLYQLITAINGVKQIKTLHIFKEGDTVPDSSTSKNPDINWCLDFDCRCLPRLDLSASRLSINKGAGKVPVDVEELELYVMVNPPLSTKINRADDLDLPIPKGTIYTDLTDFTSIQEDFPRTYKIGRTGISSKATKLRQAQTKQLKAYLLFYDQILANYLAHLSNVRNLLALDAQDGQSFQSLYNISGIQELLTDFDPATQDWEAYKNNPNNAYVQALEQLVKGNETQHKLQKNRILDHLLGRFGEQFTDQVLRLYQIERPVKKKALLEGNLKDWTIDKQRFLDFIPQLTGERGVGFNYRSKDGGALWKTGDDTALDAEQLLLQLKAVSGLKKRVCAHLGIDDWTRHTITCEPQFYIDTELVRSPGANRQKYIFLVKKTEDSSERLLVSTNQFTSAAGVENAIQDFLRGAAKTSNYDNIDDRVGFWLNIQKADRTLDNALLLDSKFDPNTAQERLEELENLAATNCQDDSFHILEHILLRPRNELYTKTLKPMLACLDCIELINPYSFWLSVVVPAWGERFQDPQQLAIFEQRLRMEAPAHLMFRIISLERDAMLVFETSYYEWLVALCENDEAQFAQLTNELVEQMNSWNSTSNI